MNALNVNSRTIFCHDNLQILEGINSESIDLIYLDPPFNKNKVFTATIGSSAEGAEFSDIFREEDIKDEWVLTIEYENQELYSYLTGVKEFSNSYNYCYLVYMTIRLIECQRILKPTGSFYLHCDSTMSHYLKIVLDCVFGEKNFRNEIIWQRNDGRGKGSQHDSKKWGANTDTILFYTKSNNYLLNINLPIIEEELTQFNKIDEKGRKYHTGTPLFRSKSMGLRPKLCYEWRGFENPNPYGWRFEKERLEEEYQKGNIVITKTGKLERRKYIDDYKGKPIDNSWGDIARVTGGEEEATGYPTQKPLALLERIITASSNKGDVVLDPFCGCATTCIAAEKLGRKWVGVDISVKAYELVKQRLEKEVPSDLFRDEPNFLTTPPERGADDIQEQGFVYVIANKAWQGEYKVGIAKNVQNRLNSYQTSDPRRGYELKYSLQTPDFKEIERHIHHSFDNEYEWVKGDLDAIITAIENYNKQ